MKEEKELKEIVIRQNSGIVFPKNEGVNGDILILGNFNGICGEVTWHGIGNSSFEDNNFYNFESTFVTNISVLMDTLNAGNRIFIVGSKDTISYFRNLLYTIADTFMFDMPAKKRKKMFNKQVWAIDTTELYERTFVKYNSTSDYRKEAADKAIHDIVTNKIFERIKHMKFDYIIQNPPYNGSLHLDFLEKGLDLLTEKGRMVIIEPATWLINVRKNGKAKRYEALKNRLKGYIVSVSIENRNNEFGTGLQVPFSTVVIDMSKTYDQIEFNCCGEKKMVNSLYDCNLVGNYAAIWSILEKVRSFGDMMQNHLTNTDLGRDFWYAKYAEIQGGNLCSGGNGRFVSDFMYRKHGVLEYYISYSTCGYHSETTNEIRNIPGEKRDRRGRNIKGTVAENIYGTRQELENWKHFIFNNKLPLFLNIVLTIDQNNNSKDFLPWLVDKQYTDEEINEMFGFTDEEIALIDRTIKKYERNSPWFKRYMCGPDSVSDEEVNNFIKTLDE